MRKKLESLLRRLMFCSLIWVIGRTARITRINWHVFESLEARGQPYLIALWHNNVFFLIDAIYPYRYPTLVSHSRDGEDIDWVSSRFGYRNVRGSASEGGLGALRGALRLLSEGTSITITPDGPRGPRYQLKPGVVSLARRKKVPIVPICHSTTRRWELRSWDRQRLPKPFAKVAIFVGDAVWLGRDGDGEEDDRRRLEHIMREQVRLAERFTGADRLFPDPVLWGGEGG